MRRITRMFEIIQVLRAASQPVSAEALADTLEVSQRTIYRDMSALQSMRIPIEGEAGVGYMMRRGYDLPPLNFDREEIEALRVGLRMLTRTGDSALNRAAVRVCEKIDALHDEESWLQVAPWGAPCDDSERGCVSLAQLREAIRSSRKLRLTYRNAEEEETERVVRPVAMIYHVDCVILAAWCEVRGGFRHFRSDRIWSCEVLEEEFNDQATALRSLWLEQEGIGVRYAEVGPAAG